jgi:hypothetical protein
MFYTNFGITVHCRQWMMGVQHLSQVYDQGTSSHTSMEKLYRAYTTLKFCNCCCLEEIT